MSNASSTIEKENVKHSNSLSGCWTARDQWWKCLDLYDNRKEKCREQIDQLHRHCSQQWIEFFEQRREQLMKEHPQAKFMLPISALHTYLTDFRNNANHNFSSHQTHFPFDENDEDE